MGLRFSQTHVRKQEPVVPESKPTIQDALDALEKGLGMGSPACAEINHPDVVLGRIIPLVPNIKK